MYKAESDLRNVFAEMRLNKALRVKIFIFALRLAQYLRHVDKSRVFWLLAELILRMASFCYKIEVSSRTAIGWGLRIYHPFCIVIHPNSVVGARCILRHGVTLGAASISSTEAPVVGDDVEFGCFSVVVGGVVIPSGTRVAALSLTTPNRSIKDA